MTFWKLCEVYPDDCIELLFARTVNQIKSTSQDIIDVYALFNIIGGDKGDFMVYNTFNELIKSSYDEWIILKKQIVEVLKEKRLDNTYQILIITNLMIILNNSYTWQSITKMENEVNAERIGEAATRFYNAVKDAYKEIQEICIKTKLGKKEA